MNKVILIFSVIVLLFSACEDSSSRFKKTTQCDILTDYTVKTIRVIGLTEITQNSAFNPVIKVYLDLLDSSENRIKAPGIFRFELYQYIPRSTKPKGTRLQAWPDIDLTKVSDNNIYWEDFLRSYLFELEMKFNPQANRTYILEVTCITADGRRLTNIYKLRQSG